MRLGTIDQINKYQTLDQMNKYQTLLGGELGAMADPLPKGPDRDKPVKAPGKDGVPSSPYLPGKAPFKIANLADGEPDASMMYHVTDEGFFLDGQGNAYMQQGGRFYDAGEYDPDSHGLPVPLVKRMQINQNKSMKIYG